jgi:hypothetical protein
VTAAPHESRLQFWLGCLALIAAAFLAHGVCLWDGSVLDDHWHQHNLRRHGWTPSELIRSTVIDTSEFITCWWQTRPVHWEYARPLFIFCMKFIYVVLGGNSPLGLHLFSVLLHAASAVMVWRLARRLAGPGAWTWAAGLLFVVYPHAVMSVQWPSAQNVVLQTALLLAALLVYLPPAALDANRRDDWRATRGRQALTAGLWLAALFSRENAVLFPAMLAACDLAFGGRRRLRAGLPFYAVLAVICVAFAAWRIAIIPQGMPDVYVRRPDGNLLEYGLWCAAKALHYVATSVWFAPMTIGPTGRYNPWTEAPGDCGLMLAIVAFVGAAYWAATRRSAGWWLWPLWIGLAIAPVIPVVATAHSGYPCGVAYCVGFALCTRKIAQDAHAAPRIARGVMLASLLASCGMTVLNRWQWNAIIAAEKWVPEWVAAAPPGPRVRDVFFINLPFVNVYAKRPLVERLGPQFESVRVHALTFAPQPALVEEPVVVERVDEFAFSVSYRGQPAFSRLLGRFLLEGFRGAGPLDAGDEVRTSDVLTRILETNEHGVTKLLFRFPRPLSDPAYAFYLTSPEVGAARLFAPRGGPPALAIEDRRRLQRVAAFVADALGDPIADVLRVRPATDPLAPPPRIRPAPPIKYPELSAAQWDAVQAWWNAEVSAAVLRETWDNRARFDELVKAREELPHARQWMALVIRSDLYLTGPPFPGPRRR